MPEREIREAQPGDTLVASRFTTLHMATVQRVTATQIVTDIGKFRRADGRAVGGSGSWDRPNLRWPRAGEIEAITKRRLLDGIEYMLRKNGIIGAIPLDSIASFHADVEEAWKGKA